MSAILRSARTPCATTSSIFPYTTLTSDAAPSSTGSFTMHSSHHRFSFPRLAIPDCHLSLIASFPEKPCAGLDERTAAINELLERGFDFTISEASRRRIDESEGFAKITREMDLIRKRNEQSQLSIQKTKFDAARAELSNDDDLRGLKDPSAQDQEFPSNASKGEQEPIDYADIRQRITWLLASLKHHQARGADLVYEAYGLDI